MGKGHATASRISNPNDKGQEKKIRGQIWRLRRRSGRAGKDRSAGALLFEPLTFESLFALSADLAEAECVLALDLVKSLQDFDVEFRLQFLRQTGALLQFVRGGMLPSAAALHNETGWNGRRG